jgi:DNA polymerase III subunit delta'
MTFREIAGHRRVKNLLSGAASRGSVPPTLLFAGPHGIGKTLVAEATAAAINCLSPILSTGELPLDACGSCRSCDRISRGVHVDVTLLEPDENAGIRIDVVRDVLERTAFRPFEGRRRVVIVREADALLDSSQNALLKSLEEPPPGTIFILTTAIPGALLPTVRSRCMRLRFGRLAETEVAEILERRHSVDPVNARAAAALADGSVGQALALGSTDLAVFREVALQLLQQSARGTAVAARLQAASVIIVGTTKKDRTREEMTLVLRLVASILRDVELIKSGADAHALANPAISKELNALVPAFDGDRAHDAFDAVNRGMAALERNAGTKVVAEWLAAAI